ncbi:hypothetical protein HPB48_020156 [Haemaphysalis longicornis]|uniref:Uncharacterized protein n=1 Tax=Haemaphysalis longicornis TaxID=44386 RepID=A0A9J6FHA2_HAELO|nr:hypothetical protein HPB48_020156 [Haemaphysalis longicornis]
MSAGSYEYKLLGFSRELDLRPLQFVSPMPPARICSVCGLVPQVIGSLLCGHVLCKRCYQRCLVDGVLICPLDLAVCPEDDVLWMRFPAENLIGKQVKCWNVVNGCNVTTAVSNIARHFQKDCEYHVINCPKCSRKVLSGDLYHHLRCCGSLAEHSAARANFGHYVDERKSQKNRPQNAGQVALLKAVLEEHTNEWRRELEELSSSHNDRLNEAKQKIAALKDSLDTERNHTKEQIKRSQKVAAECKKESERHAAELAALNKKLEILRAQVDELSVVTNLHSGVVEKMSNFMNAVEAALRE